MKARANRKLNFEEAEKLAQEAKENQGTFEKVTFQQGKDSVEPKDLPFISDCYNLGSSETRQAIENLNNCLSIETAKKLSKVYQHLHLEDFEALLRKEAPHLHAAYRQGLTTAALHTFIDFRAGKKVSVNVRTSH